MESNDMAPHSAIVHVTWEVHEKKQDGTFYGGSKQNGTTVIVLNGNDLALTTEYVNALIDLIKQGGKNVSELKVNEERLGQARIQGASRPRNNDSNVFGMRGGIGKNPSSRPEPTSSVPISGGLSALRRP